MNPYDTFPPRNLPPEAEPWGRATEDRVRNIEYALTGLGQSVDSQGRSNASSLSDLARQVVILGDTVNRVDRLFRSVPKAAQASDTVRSFGVVGGIENNVLEVSLVSPYTGTAVITASASGQQVGSMLNQSVVVRVSCNGDNSPGIGAAMAESRVSYSAGYSWTKSVSEGQLINVRLLINPAVTWPSNALSYAALTMLATFTQS